MYICDMAKRTTTPLQRQMLAALLMMPKGQALFPLLRHVDSGVFEEEFSDRAARKAVESLGRFYGRFKALPSKEAWQDWRRSDAPLVKWLDTCPDEEEGSFVQLEAAMFRPPQDPDYTVHKLAQFITRMFMVRSMKDEALELSVSGTDPVEIFEKTRQERVAFHATLQSALDGHAREASEITGEVRVDDLADTVALETLVPGLRLYRRGLTVLASPPKSFKTGLMQSVAVDLARRGAWVFYADLENGEAKSRRRFYQNMLNCPKEWLWSRVWLDEASLPVRVFRRGEEYNKGDEVVRVTPVKGEDGWRLEGRKHRALCDDPYAVEDWSPGTGFDLEEYLHPVGEVLEQALQAFPGKLWLEYIKGASVARLGMLAKAFFAPAPAGVPKVMLIDWGQHVKNTNSKLNYWEKIRDNYAQLKDLRDEEDLHVLMVEAPKDYTKLSDPMFKKKDLRMAGTENIGFDVESLLVMLATEEEREKGWRRIMVVEDRDAESGDHTTSFLRLDYERMQVAPVDLEDHRAACPDFWRERDGAQRERGAGKGFKVSDFKPKFKGRVEDE